MIRRPPRSTQSRSSAASDVYKRQCKDHPSLAAALRALAADIGTRIGADAKRPVQFDRFPTVGLVAHSFKVVPKDVLGQSFLTGGFEAEYGMGKAAWRLTLIPFEGAEKETA